MWYCHFGKRKPYGPLEKNPDYRRELPYTIKFMFSKKATKIDKIFTVDLTLTYLVNVKSTVKILSIFVAFLENMNFAFGQTILFFYKILTQLFWVLQTLIRFMAISTMTSLSGLVRSPFSKIRTNFPCIAKFLQFDMIHKSVGNSNEIHWILMHFVFSFICTVLPSP